MLMGALPGEKVESVELRGGPRDGKVIGWCEFDSAMLFQTTHPSGTWFARYIRAGRIATFDGYHQCKAVGL
jgi:hypothetical protein